MDMKFHHKVRKSYLKLAKLNNKRFIKIDGTKTISQIENKIWNIVENEYF